MHILVPFTNTINSDLKKVSDFLDTLEKNAINITPWPEFSYKPKVSFAISYTEDSILLKYYVSETSFRAVYNESNDAVYRDSCVEFFIELEGDDNYYNLEFNSIGTCLASYGKDKPSRKSLPVDIIEKIRYQSVVRAQNSSGKSIYWELTLVIPLDVFHFHTLKSMKNKVCRANFYKCGDDLPLPHFLAWNNINSDEPNFHLPEFFGKAEFI